MQLQPCHSSCRVYQRLLRGTHSGEASGRGFLFYNKDFGRQLSPSGHTTVSKTQQPSFSSRYTYWSHIDPLLGFSAIQPPHSSTMSPSERQIVANRHPWTLPQLTAIDGSMQPITRKPPGDTTKPAALTMGRAELSRRKTHYYEEAFSGRCVMDTLRERIRSDSMVVAELKTNVIVSRPPTARSAAQRGESPLFRISLTHHRPD